MVDLGFLELLAMVPTFKKDVYPFARCSTYDDYDGDANCDYDQDHEC